MELSGIAEDGRFEAIEWNSPETAGADPPNLKRRLLTCVLAPIALIGRLARLEGVPLHLGRWPEPRNRLSRQLVQVVDGFLSLMRSLLFGPIILLFTFAGLLNLLPKVTPTDPGVVGPAPEMGFGVFLLLLPVVMLGVAVLFAVNFVLHRATRHTLIGLARTYIEVSGVPPWVRARDNVITLPIPQGVVTLSFALSDVQIDKTISLARERTRIEVRRILAGSDGV